MIANTDAMAYRFPIDFPPGRDGIEPALFLAYNSRSGNGWAGVLKHTGTKSTGRKRRIL